jgi:hypothetical protein
MTAVHLLRAGHSPTGVRRIVQRTPDDVDALRATIAAHDPASCAAARVAVDDAIEVAPP